MIAASPAAGKTHGYEVGYDTFTTNGRVLGRGDPIRVKKENGYCCKYQRQRNREPSLALPGGTFTVLVLDGNPVLNPTQVQWTAPPPFVWDYRLFIRPA